MNWGAEYIGATLLAVGALLFFRRKKRTFDRTNPFGVERFPGYWAKVRARAKDALITGAWVAFSVAGVLVLAFRYEDSWGWIVLFPLAVYAIFVMIGT